MENDEKDREAFENYFAEKTKKPSYAKKLITWSDTPRQLGFFERFIVFIVSCFFYGIALCCFGYGMFKTASATYTVGDRMYYFAAGIVLAVAYTLVKDRYLSHGG